MLSSKKIEWLTHCTKEHLNGFKKEKRIFLKRLHYPLDLRHPKTFNEKIIWKKVYDRNPLLPITADKYRVREYIRHVLGKKQAANILIPLYATSTNPDTIDFRALPESYIIKTNHASQTNIFVQKNGSVDKNDIKDRLKKWLKKPYGLFNHEWSYIDIKPMIIIEKLLTDNANRLPIDFKFFIFHGKCHYIFVYTNRKEKISCSIFDTAWQKQPIAWKDSVGPKVEKPDNLAEMIEIAETLSSPFDFVRVDLYSFEDNIYFSELTHYPASGHMEMQPREFDISLGKLWELERNYWKKKNHLTRQIIKEL